MHVPGANEDTLRITTVGRYQILILVLGILVMFADGFDAQMVGFVAPSLTHAWGVTNTVFSPVFAANVFGLMIGSMTIPVLADMIGRKLIIVACVTLFGLASMATALVTNVQELSIMRLISGLTLGGAMPCVISFGSDYFPVKIRTRLAVLLSTAWSLGIAICGIVTGGLVETRGWQAIFFIGGVLPLVLAPILLFVLPESPAFLIAKGRLDQLRAILAKIDPNLGYAPEAAPPPLPRFPLTALFRPGLVGTTLLVWLAYVSAGVTVYFFLQWMGILVRDSGYSTGQAAYVSSLYQFGGMVGGIFISIAVDRWGAIALTGSLLLASLAVACLGLAAPSLIVLAVCAALTGALVVGSQNTSNAYVGSRLYPSEIRASGLGWALGVLRLSGVIAGSWGLGLLIDLNLGPVSTLRIIALPEVVAALAFLGIHFVLRARARQA